MAGDPRRGTPFVINVTSEPPGNLLIVHRIRPHLSSLIVAPADSTSRAAADGVAFATALPIGKDSAAAEVRRAAGVAEPVGLSPRFGRSRGQLDNVLRPWPTHVLRLFPSSGYGLITARGVSALSLTVPELSVTFCC